MDCLPLSTLMEAVLAGETPEHTTDCPTCAAQLQRARELLSLLRSASLEPVPDHLRDAALDAPASSRRRARRTVVARPATSPGRRLAVRGGGSRARKHFEAGPYDVDVERLDSGAVVGQVLPRDEHGEVLASADCLLFGGGRPHECRLGEHGEFRFTDVEPGTYALIVETKEQRLFLPGLALKE